MDYLTLLPDAGAPARIITEALSAQTQRIDALLCALPFLRDPSESQTALAELVVATATSQLLVARLLLKEYH